MQKLKSPTYQVYDIQQRCVKFLKMTSFRDKMRYIKTFNLTQKYLISC